MKIILDTNTGDKDLLVLKGIKSTEIIKPRNFKIN
jgi:predicted nucleic acid-binding protein